MRSIIEEQNEIPEMHLLRHKHDTGEEEGYNYADNALRRATSSALWANDNMNDFLTRLSDMYVTLVDTVLPTRNIFFWSYNKYYNGHGK